MLRRFVASLCLALCAAAPAAAYTPESGVWWNPSEPGTGLVLEIQDNYIAVAAFVGDNNGNPTWYTATGFLSGNARFVGQLDYFPGVQCIGCGYMPPAVSAGRGGSIQIDFDVNDPTRATLRWGGRTLPIERYAFYLKRPEDGSAPQTVTKMLGEWQFVLDFSTVAAINPNFVQYYGELLLLEDYDLSANPDVFEGCRGDNSLNGFCSSRALVDHDAVGYYDAAEREHVIVVDDSRDNFVVYVLQVGTAHAEGTFAVYRKGTNPTTFLPARGFRSASRSFVQDNVGPSKSATNVPDVKLPGIGDRMANAGIDVGNLQVKSVEPGVERERLAGILRTLEARLAE